MDTKLQREQSIPKENLRPKQMPVSNQEKFIDGGSQVVITVDKLYVKELRF